MEHQQPSSYDPRQSKPNPTAKASKPPRGEAPRKRDRSAKETPGFSDWVAAGTQSGTPVVSTVAKAVELVMSPAVNQDGASKISLRIEKPYRIHIQSEEGATHVTGELHLVPWDKYAVMVDGLIAAIADIVALAPEKILKEADIPAMADGTARPAFRLSIPRPISEDEKCQLDVAFTAFRQRMRGQDDSLNKDLFEDANPEAVAAGRRAAENVRRKAGGRSLPHALTVTAAGGNAKPVTLAGRIGEHPDPERDEEPEPISGKVIGILTEDHKIVIRSFKYKDEKGKLIQSDSGKKFTINYSQKDHGADVLKLPLGQGVVVSFTVIPRLGRNNDRLMLKSIDEVPQPAGAGGNGNTTP